MSIRTSEFAYPYEIRNIAVSKLANESAETTNNEQWQHTNNTRLFFSFFGSCCIEATRELGLKGLNVSDQVAIDCVLDSLYMF